MDTFTKDYQTKDIGCCAALLTLAQPIKTILWKDDIAYFLFPDRGACEDLAQRYYLGQLPGNCHISKAPL
jgi:hypothetical protein